jgi:uncharacterized protein YbjT (DUF2867 family)
MNVLLFGATGMVGQGALRECLLDPYVQSVQTIGRSASGVRNSKLRELVHADLWDYSSIEPALSGFDACFFCLGVSSVGMKEDAYERVTYAITLAAATTLSRLNPQMTFIYVSGAGPTVRNMDEACGHASRARPRTNCSGCRSKEPICSAPAPFSRAWRTIQDCHISSALRRRQTFAAGTPLGIS